MPAASSRFAGLDGLRGVAALVVAVHHALLTVPAFAAPYYGRPVEGRLVELITLTPVHLLWAGTEAVYLFFVLSGFVLAKSAQSPRFDWFRYVPSRLVRLYLPVAAAVVFAAVTIALVPRTEPQASPWLEARPDAYGPTSVISDLFLVSGVSRVVSPFWSLQWEIIFSLLLAAFVAVAVKLRPWIVVVVSITLSTVGAVAPHPALQYLPMFAIGVALAQLRPEQSKAVGAFRGIVLPLALLVAALLATVSHWLLLGRVPDEWLIPIAHPLALLGVTTLVVLAAWWPPLSRFLAWRPLAWLGLISFSLYLVHEPIVIAMAFFTENSYAPLLIGVPLALLVAWGFFHLVERPVHGFARRIKNGEPLTRPSKRSELQRTS
ncbi:acyltransferase family protein [Agromyces seonyuensis]|uniref:Acyltransferase family protein n=1 Tax=Agromyces seonyuensis TaxID=2662446 RepID=A0A6I4NXU5_9MICO|nr:acyltransferase [Agromyces seonyuensis]MWB97962.1 acyltransferase family protein [Agromyces seonyuensis]